jgi:hypothetical protein
VDELQCLDKQTLHQILESASLAIESEDDLLRTLISLGSGYFEFLSYIEVIFLTDEGLSLFVDKLSFDDLTLEIWRQVVFRLKGVSDEEVRCRPHRHDRHDH